MSMQRMILFALFVTVSYATTINFFDAQIEVPFPGNLSTIFDTYIELWTDVTDCPQPVCSCEVQTNATDDGDTFAIIFLESKPNIGHVEIKNLTADTLYSFNLSCVEADKIVTRLFRTDYGRPSVPQNITVVINSKRLRVSWLPSLVPAGPIDKYRLTIVGDKVIDDLSNDTLSYDTTEDYIYGKEYVFMVEACNKNRRNEIPCSNINDGKTSIYIPLTTTTGTPNSSNVLSYSIGVLIFIFYFLSIC